MKNENLTKWVEALRDPALEQVTARLAEIVDDLAEVPTIGFCCLGVGERLRGSVVSEPERYEYDDDDDYEPERVLPIWSTESVGFSTPEGDTVSELPSEGFHKWLGLTAAGVDGADVPVDWPQGEQAYLQRPARGPAMTWTCAELNDSVRLTFPQIADVLAYFGVRDEQ